MKRKRPPSLTGISQRIDSGQGKLYVNINVKDDEPFEVFVNTGRSGGFTNAWNEALGKTISIALRMTPNGIDPSEVSEEYDVDEEVIEQIIDDLTVDPIDILDAVSDELMGIRAGNVGVDNGDDVYSMPDAVGLALKRFVLDSPGESIRGARETDLP